MIFVEADKNFDSFRRVARSWARRTRALRNRVAYESAVRTRATLMETIPTGREWNEYRDSLDIAEVQGLGMGEAAYTLRSRIQARGVDTLKEESTILYVRVNRQMRVVRPSIEILEKYNPWTVDTIPFYPPSTVAKILSRETTKLTTGKVRKRRIKDRRLWQTELSQVGVRVQNRPAKKDTAKAISDVAYSAFKLEFGLGVKPHPHWRPALKNLQVAVPRRLSNNPKIRRLFTDPSFTGWKRWEKIQTPTRILPSEARKYIPFQRKLGIRT